MKRRVDPKKEVRRQFFAHFGQRAVDDVVFSVVGHEVEVLAVGHEIGDLGRGDRFHPGAHVYQEPFLVNRWRRVGAPCSADALPPPDRSPSLSIARCKSSRPKGFSR